MSQDKKQRAESARRRAEQMRKEAEARSRRMRTIVIALTAVIVLGLVGAAVVVVQNARERTALAEQGPAGMGDNGGLVLGEESAEVMVTEYIDFMCPGCQAFEAANADMRNQLLSEGKIQAEIVPIAILDGQSQGTEYSSRAAGAGYCVMESDPDKFADFMAAMFMNQPAEGTSAMTSEEIAGLAGSVEVSQAGQDCITSDKYQTYAKAQTRTSSENGVRGTPTVMINGEQVETAEYPARLNAAIAG